MTCSRANFRAAGWDDEDIEKPLVTVGSPWTNAMPCNNRIRELADVVMEAIEQEGGKPVAAGTPVISDGRAPTCRPSSAAARCSLPAARRAPSRGPDPAPAAAAHGRP